MTTEERAKILEMVAAGKLTPDEASELLAVLGDVSSSEEQDAQPDAEVDESYTAPPMEAPRFGNVWLIPLYVGLVVFVCGALAVFPLYDSSGSWLLVVCGWPLFFLGLLTMLIAWFVRKSRWIHIRVSNVDGGQRNIKISLPIPLGLTAFAFRIGARFVPQLQDTNVDEVITALNEGLQQDEPLFIDVQEGDDGERVQVFIG